MWIDVCFQDPWFSLITYRGIFFYEKGVALYYFSILCFSCVFWVFMSAQGFRLYAFSITIFGNDECDVGQIQG